MADHNESSTISPDYEVNLFSQRIHEDDILQREQLATKDSEPNVKKIECKNIKLDNPSFKHFANKIDALKMPQSWGRGNALPPNVSAKEKAKRVFDILFKKYEILPDQILPSIEGGVALFYKSSFNRAIIMNIEIYNDLDVDALVNDDKNKKMIKCEDIQNLNFENIIKIFVSVS